ncbi:Pr6Pr family membrane protein [Devosia sp.]|uniref:Pr6Pr family membrane protein n=1 Tax=Devosia sp. TaxID=1871048 RepID=UPI0032678A32
MNPRAPVNPRRLLVWLGLFFGSVALVLQFTLSMQLHAANGRDLPGAMGNFFSYYTILTNIVLVLIYLSLVLKAKWLEPFRSPVTRAMMAANIALVTLFVYFVLRHLYAFEGLFDLADRMLHYLCPTLYLLWWLFAQPHGGLKWLSLPIMLLPTLIYFIYIIARGAWVQEYPYPVINVIDLGYPQVLLNAVLMTIGLAVLTAIVILLDGFIARRAVAHD